MFAEVLICSKGIEFNDLSSLRVCVGRLVEKGDYFFSHEMFAVFWKGGAMHVVVVMPTYNESGNIGEMIDTLVEQVFPSMEGTYFSLLIVDDNSPDGTGRVVALKAKQYNCVFLSTGEKKGLGYAVCRGMSYAMETLHADAVVEMDADFQHSPDSLKALVFALQAGADCVVGSRYVSGAGASLQWPKGRRWLSRIGNRIGAPLTGGSGVGDITSGFRITRVSGVLDCINLDRIMAKAWYAYKIHLLYEVCQCTNRVVEVPIVFMPRRCNQSKFNPVEIFKTLEVLWRIYRIYGYGH